MKWPFVKRSRYEDLEQWHEAAIGQVNRLRAQVSAIDTVKLKTMLHEKASAHAIAAANRMRAENRIKDRLAVAKEIRELAKTVDTYTGMKLRALADRLMGK